MFTLRSLLVALAAVSVLATPLEVRQTSNTNAAINTIIDSLDESIHVTIPSIVTDLASETATPAQFETQLNNLLTAFNAATKDLAATPVSSGSTTTAPTNDDININFSDVMSLLASTLAGLSPTDDPSIATTFPTLDTAVAATVKQLNTTLPGSSTLDHIMMLDAQQFLTRINFTATRTALGF